MKTLKCVLVGEGCVGKTALLEKYTKGHLDDLPLVATVFDNYEANVWIDETEHKLGLWDTGGNELYRRFRRLSYPDTDIFILCYSVADPEFFEKITEKWLPELRHFCPKVPFILVGTKVDLRKDPYTIKELLRKKEKPVTQIEGRDMATKTKAARYFECSAQTGEGVENVFNAATLCALDYVSKKSVPLHKSVSSWVRKTLEKFTFVNRTQGNPVVVGETSSDELNSSKTLTQRSNSCEMEPETASGGAYPSAFPGPITAPNPNTNTISSLPSSVAKSEQDALQSSTTPASTQ